MGPSLELNTGSTQGSPSTIVGPSFPNTDIITTIIIADKYASTNGRYAVINSCTNASVYANINGVFS